MTCNKQKPFVSFIVPVLDTEAEYLEQCIKSLLAIKNAKVEILIINNCSTRTETLNVLNKYINNRKIRLFEEKNKGVSLARNRGLEFADGDYVVFVDSDDFITTEIFDYSIERVLNYPNVSLFVYTHNDVNENGEILFTGCNTGESFECSSIFKVYESGTKIEASFIRETVWGKIYKKSIVKNVKFDADLKYGEDNLFVLNTCAQDVKIMAVANAFYNYRRGKKSVTNKYTPNINEERLKNIEKLEKFYIMNQYNEELVTFYKDVIFRSYLHLILRLSIFHKDCPEKFRKKRKRALELLHSEPYGRMLSRIKLNTLKFKEIIICFLLKVNLVYLAYLVFLMHMPNFIKKQF